MSENNNKPVQEEPAIDLAEFLESVPPQTATSVKNFLKPKNGRFIALTPALSLHCPHPNCVDKGNLIHRCTGNDDQIAKDPSLYTYLYECPNCKLSYKSYTVKILQNTSSTDAKCIKVGEYPNYGPVIPSRLIKMIGPDRDLFLKGRRCEIQGLGIGSFSYYRRVIEHQKIRLFDEIIKVTKLLEADSQLITELEEAKKEGQFTKSIEAIKTGLPQTLFIGGENPLTLLHGALSEGLHAKTDEECLEIAGNIRVVLTALAQKITNALNDDKELTNAVKGLKKLRDAG